MPGTLPISVLLLARDADRDLAELLPALAFARDVVVVVDTASDPATRAEAERHGARVFERPLDGFGAQRAFALARCREPWVLWIDTDERLPADAAAVLGAAIAAADGASATDANAVAGYTLARHGFFLGRRIRFCGWRGERVLRLFRRERARFDDAPVHEAVHVSGGIAALPVSLAHHSYAHWFDCRDKLVPYARAGAEAARRRGRRASALDVVARPPLRFLRMYVLQLGVLDGGHGAVLCALAAAQVFLKYAELWADPAGAPPKASPPGSRPPAPPHDKAPPAPGSGSMPPAPPHDTAPPA